MPADSSLFDIASAGDKLATLRALRDRIAAEIDRAAGKGMTVAALAVRLVEVLDDIEAAAPKGMSKRDELAQKRRERQADVARSAAPANPGRPRRAK